MRVRSPRYVTALVLTIWALVGIDTGSASASAGDPPCLLVPERVFDGEAIQEGWVVLVEGELIRA